LTTIFRRAEVASAYIPTAFKILEAIMVDKDRIQGSAEQAKGKVKEVVGKETGDNKLEGEGKADQFKGKVQNAVGGLKDTRVAPLAAHLRPRRERWKSIPNLEPGFSAATVEPDFSELFMSYLLTRNSRIEEDLIDQLFNSSEKHLARLLLLLANFGKEGKPTPIVGIFSQETLAEMIGMTRSRVSCSRIDSANWVLSNTTENSRSIIPC
jgi:uncharacterized protein YjbJ (UPF0337 family)